VHAPGPDGQHQQMVGAHAGGRRLLPRSAFFCVSVDGCFYSVLATFAFPVAGSSSTHTGPGLQGQPWPVPFGHFAFAVVVGKRKKASRP
jgi:hypothetical protein